MSYSELLQAAYAAEVEAEKGRVARSKAANVVPFPEKGDVRSRDPSPIVASVAALESKLDKCLKAVSKATQAQTSSREKQQGNHKREANSAPTTPNKSKGACRNGSGSL